jgi:RNA-directed DNA polymerase
LLSNLVLDVLDKELERRGHRFVRYADDCNIYVRSRRAGERVMASVEHFLTRRLKLRVNAAKSGVDQPEHRKFLGFSFRIGPAPKRRIAPAALDRFKQRVRDLTRRQGGNSLDTVIERLARYLIGGGDMLGSANCRRRGIDHDLAARTAGSGHGPWRMALTPALHLALPNAFFTALGLPFLVVRAT